MYLTQFFPIHIKPNELVNSYKWAYIKFLYKFALYHNMNEEKKGEYLLKVGGKTKRLLTNNNYLVGLHNIIDKS